MGFISRRPEWDGVGAKKSRGNPYGIGKFLGAGLEGMRSLDSIGDKQLRVVMSGWLRASMRWAYSIFRKVFISRLLELLEDNSNVVLEDGQILGLGTDEVRTYSLVAGVVMGECLIPHGILRAFVFV